MELHTGLYAALLGLIEGVTAFIPVSSDGHLIFLENAGHFPSPRGRWFEISVQLGALVAIGWYYRTRLHNVITHPTDRAVRSLMLNLLIAFLPACVFGILFRTMVLDSLFHLWVAGVTMLLGGIAVVCVERWKPPTATFTLDAITPVQAFVIGMYQAIALVPGVSRLAATLLGGLLLGIDRKAATEFSFLLAIPTVLGAVALTLATGYHSLTAYALAIGVMGAAMACVSAVFVIGWCVRYLSGNGMQLLGWYRILVGGAVTLALFLAK